MENNFVNQNNTDPIRVIDDSINIYVDQIVDQIFYGQSIQNVVLRSDSDLTRYSINDLAKIQEQEKETARRVLRVVASIEKYHQETIKRNVNQVRVTQNGDIGRTTKLQLLSQMQHSEPLIKRTIKGIKKSFSKAVCICKNNTLEGVKVYAKSYALKCARKLSLNTYLRDINNDKYLSEKIALTMKEVLARGGKISECFDINNPIFRSLEGFYDMNGQYIPGSGYLGEMRKALIDSEMIRRAYATRGFDGRIYSNKQMLDNPRAFFNYQARYDFISDKILDFESMALPIATARNNVDRQAMGELVLQRIKGFISPYYESQESYIQSLQRLLFDISKEIRVDQGHNEYSFEDIRKMVERTYKTLRTKAVITENLGINKGDDHYKALKLKRYDQSTKVSMHKSTFTPDKVESANKCITIATGVAMLGATAYYLFQVPDRSHWITYGAMAAAAGVAYATVAAKKIKDKFTVTKGSSYFKNLSEEEQYAINCMVADRINAIEEQAKMMQRPRRSDRGYNMMEP